VLFDEGLGLVTRQESAVARSDHAHAPHLHHSGTRR
jgi:hypothetical protein